MTSGIWYASSNAPKLWASKTVGADVTAVIAHDHHDRFVQDLQPLELIQERAHLHVELADEGVVHRPRLAPLALADGAEHLALAPVEPRAVGEGVSEAGG